MIGACSSTYNTSSDAFFFLAGELFLGSIAGGFIYEGKRERDRYLKKEISIIFNKKLDLSKRNTHTLCKIWLGVCISVCVLKSLAAPRQEE